ncbi:MAG: hypothetical protein NVS1B10_00730 [Candidatus Saccharimonadales bacterium]
MPSSQNLLTKIGKGSLAILILVVVSSTALPLKSSASGFNNRKLQLASSTTSASTDYTFSFTIANNSNIGSISLLLCTNSPIETDSCVLPNGIDVSQATLTSQIGITDFTMFVAAPNYIVLSRTPSLITAPLSVTLKFSNVINPSSQGSYYGKLAAYSSTNGTGSSVLYGGLAFAIANSLQISSVVPPYISFCAALTIANYDCTKASGDYINFGKINSTSTAQATSQLLVATNAANGYGIQVYGTTMTSGNNVIKPINPNSSSIIGTSQFGLNLRSNQTPQIGSDPVGPGNGQPTTLYGQADQYRYVSNENIVSTMSADDFRKYTVSYIVNIDNAQPPGVYVSTLTYVCSPSF